VNEIDRRRLARPTADIASRLKTIAARGGRLTTEDSDAGLKPSKPGRADYLSVKAELQERLLDEIGERGLLENDGADVAAAVKEFAARAIASEDIPLNEAERVRLAEELTDETIGMGPLAPLLADPAVSDILVNAPDKVYVERFGKLEKTDVRFRDAEHIIRVIERIAARVGRRIDTSSPMADLRLPDGSRVNATLPPVTIDGPTLSIRRFGRRRLRREDLLNLGTLSPEMLEFLVIAVRARKNILVSGGTGAGKSTLLGVLAEAIPDHERIVTIEDTAELSLDQEHVVRMETRPVNIEGRGRILARDLLINALRMRPDRIIVGEVRGAEALDLLKAWGTGHPGGIGTIHAGTAIGALRRLEQLIQEAVVTVPRALIAETIDLVAVLSGRGASRRLAELAGVEGLGPSGDYRITPATTGTAGDHA
jgi:pilus assembly protein CpaF